MKPLASPLKSRSMRPAVLCLAGHDPSGGAGLQADIEAVAAVGGHALGILTALTVQDSRNVRKMVPVRAALIAEQLRCVVADSRPRAIKIGLLASQAQLAPILEVIENLKAPVVCDPVLRAGGGRNLSSATMIAALCHRLLPQVSVLTPNAAEARRLSGRTRLDDCARVLLDRGCAHVLITGGDEPGKEVINTWHTGSSAPMRFRWPRFPEIFHGAGCTLAAAIAGRLAQGDEVGTALEFAQRWTHETLRRAFAVGRGRRIPGRWLPSGHE